MTPEQRAGFKAEMRKLVGKIDPAIVNGTATKEDDARKLAEVNARLRVQGVQSTPASETAPERKLTNEERGRIVSTLTPADMEAARNHFQNGGWLVSSVVCQ